MEFDSTNMKIKIIGIGGGGCNTVKRLSKRKDQISVIEYYAANTDKDALNHVRDEGENINIIRIGEKGTRGCGAGANPAVGKAAIEESKGEIEDAIGDANLLFITAGMGGGTGTGGAPVVAKLASEKQILTIGVVTLPFVFEGLDKLNMANAGIAEMRKYVDIMIVVSNQKAFDSCGAAAPLSNIFEKADEVLIDSIKGITDIITRHSLINLDFADISSVIRGKKTAHIGLGCASGENRMFKALRMACNNELLNTTIEHAKNIIINVVVDSELTGEEVNKSLSLIPKVVEPNAKIKHGLDIDPTLKQEVHVTIIATGFTNEEEVEEIPEIEVEESEELILGRSDNILSTAEEIVAPANNDVIDNLLKRLQNRNK